MNVVLGGVERNATGSRGGEDMLVTEGLKASFELDVPGRRGGEGLTGYALPRQVLEGGEGCPGSAVTGIRTREKGNPGEGGPPLLSSILGLPCSLLGLGALVSLPEQFVGEEGLIRPPSCTREEPGVWSGGKRQEIMQQGNITAKTLTQP